MSDPMDDYFTSPHDPFDHKARDNPKPHEGMQICMLTSYGEKQTQKSGRIIAADLIIVQPAQGSTYAAGAKIKIAWFINDSDLLNRRYERKRSDDFIMGLIGLPGGTACGPHARNGGSAAQPWRGIMVKIHGVRNGKYMNYTYEHIPQTPEMIINNRHALDAREASEAPSLPAAPAPQTQQYQGAPQMPQGHYPQTQAVGAPAAPAGPPPWNPAWGPMPPGYGAPAAASPGVVPTGIPGFKLPGM